MSEAYHGTAIDKLWSLYHAVDLDDEKWQENAEIALDQMLEYLPEQVLEQTAKTYSKKEDFDPTEFFEFLTKVRVLIGLINLAKEMELIDGSEEKQIVENIGLISVDSLLKNSTFLKKLIDHQYSTMTNEEFYRFKQMYEA